MPWKEFDTVSLRFEFIQLAMREGANIAEMCRRFGIARKTAYKWIERYERHGSTGLIDQSRRPHKFRHPTLPAMEQSVLEVRREHPCWGGRKIRRRLQDLGHLDVPAASTITAILHRHGCIDPAESDKRHRDWIRFERPEPNDLWQMDFKGQFQMSNSRWCYPLTILDDHSRYSLGIRSCGDQQGLTVKGQMTGIFRLYGLPRAMLMDNGVPWSMACCPGRLTRLGLWLMRLGIEVLHGRPYHPQTQGKEERFHRTLEAELLRGRRIDDLYHAQSLFDPWRTMYNHDRPHEALGMATPASRYQVSACGFPEALPPVEYGSGEIVRKVAQNGTIHFRGRMYWLTKSLVGEPVCLRPTSRDGVYRVYYCHCCLGELSLGELRDVAIGTARLFASVRCAHFGEQPGSGDDKTL